MSVAPASTSSVLVAVSGVLQDPSTYSVSGTTLTFSGAPPSGTSNISVRFLGIPASGVTTTAYRTVTEFTATASQTTFSVPSYTVGFIDVYRNGVMLGSADYTATNGTTVVLATGATAGDLVEVISFQVSSVLNAIPASPASVQTSYLVDGSVTTAKIADLNVTTAKIADNSITTAKIAAGAVVQADLATGVAGTGPAFSAYKVGSSQTGFSNSTATKVLLDGELFDTASCFDTATNYRFTPNVAGYYQIQGCVETNWLTSQFGFYKVSIYKNGSEYVRSQLNTSTTIGNYPSISVSSVIYFNGSTDYVELYVFSTGGSNPAYDQGSVATFMSGALVRSA
jgi:hypothetical protein